MRRKQAARPKKWRGMRCQAALPRRHGHMKVVENGDDDGEKGRVGAHEKGAAHEREEEKP